ncbi:MAG TPA: protein translocase subunit SecF [Cellvibrionales bacterium]|jgi:preprotein translocase subunit SecF|nr:protein translocase subunit SecF [Cellvibrionales bacterium]HAW14434.1 protein translocase subunit SecF [Cellvibrionales bacterium]HCX26738.1 protein translocase subunit SecF [Cellvibrionales bacterium]
MALDNTLNFMGYRKIAQIASAILLVISIASLSTNGLKLGLDFTGGTLVEVAYDKTADLGSIRSALETAGYNNALVINFGSDQDVLVRLPQSNNSQLGDELLAVLKNGHEGDIDLHRIEYVGPQVGEELREQGGLGLLAALISVMIYVTFRFQFKFSIGAVVALAHDVIIVLGFFSLLRLDFDLTVLAAILAVIGYSLNDTIVVSDRIRENFRLVRKGRSEDIINRSLTQTLGRTLMTSITTLLVLTSLFVFGGEIIHGFATALIVGVFIGTYSSIFVAANMLLALNISQEDLAIPVVEGADHVDGMP